MIATTDGGKHILQMQLRQLLETLYLLIFFPHFVDAAAVGVMGGVSLRPSPTVGGKSIFASCWLLCLPRMLSNGACFRRCSFLWRREKMQNCISSLVEGICRMRRGGSGSAMRGRRRIRQWPGRRRELRRR
jgi:hypothetical protein